MMTMWRNFLGNSHNKLTTSFKQSIDFSFFTYCWKRSNYVRAYKMAEDNFYVHLISNAAPHVFPNNSPAHFSTPLAHDIDLGKGKWEVAVQQILYPTQIATTSSADKVYFHKLDSYYRNMLAYPPVYFDGIENSGSKISFNLRNVPAGALVTYIKHTTMYNEFSKSSYFAGISFNDKKDKFVLDVANDDIVVVMSKKLQTILQFQRNYFTRGRYESRQLLNDKPYINNSHYHDNVEMYFVDLQALHSEKRNLPFSVDASKKYYSYETTVPYIFKDTIPDDFTDNPKFSFGIYPNEGKIKMKTLKPASFAKVQAHENKVLFFRFDANTTRQLKLRPLYYCDGKKKDFKFKIVDNANTLKSLSKLGVSVELFYQSRNENVYPAPTQELSNSLALPVTKTEDANTLVAELNKNGNDYDYTFAYDTGGKRFNLTVKSRRYAVSLGKHLASVLGFDIKADDKPFMKGFHVAKNAPNFDSINVTSLYLHTNIINGVHFGHEKIPLLLTCPFQKKGNLEKLHEVQFINPIYAPVNRTVLRVIDIGIYSDTDNNELVPFVEGHTNLSLHFRRQKSYVHDLI